MNSDRISLETVRLDGEDFSGLKLRQFTATQSVLRRCRFRRTRIGQACFGCGTVPSIYSDCTFDGSRITAIAPGVATFVRCSFRDCVIQHFFGNAVEFVNCFFSGKIRKAVFHGQIPQEDRELIGRDTNEFRGNDFSEATLSDVAFRGGIDLTAQKLPRGADYLYLAAATSAIEQVRCDVIGWKDLDDRRIALAILRALEMDLESGQEQLFLTRDSVPGSQRNVFGRVFSDLRRADLETRAKRRDKEEEA